MRTAQQVFFWFVVAAILLAGFGNSYNDYSKTFYFITFLLPVAIGTSYFFNFFLVPKYLLTGKYYRFAVYTIYTLIGSLYLMMVVITVSFVIISNYNYQDLGPFMSNIFILALAIYLVVFAKAFLVIFNRLKEQEVVKSQLIEDKKALKTEFITVKSNRRNRQIKLDEIIYLESMGDYVDIHSREDTVMTKENISTFESILPENFIRIHRSFIVNQNFVTSFKSNEMIVNDVKLPISRSYKNRTHKILTEDSIS